jgi:Ca2+/Na+ antiporter
LEILSIIIFVSCILLNAIAYFDFKVKYIKKILVSIFSLVAIIVFIFNQFKFTNKIETVLKNSEGKTEEINKQIESTTHEDKYYSVIIAASNNKNDLIPYYNKMKIKYSNDQNEIEIIKKENESNFKLTFGRHKKYVDALLWQKAANNDNLAPVGDKAWLYEE